VEQGGIRWDLDIRWDFLQLPGLVLGKGNMKYDTKLARISLIALRETKSIIGFFIAILIILEVFVGSGQE